MSQLHSTKVKDAKRRIRERIGSRAAKRIEKFINLANKTITENIIIDNPDMVLFKMSDATKKKITSNLMQCVAYWNDGTQKHFAIGPNASTSKTRYRKTNYNPETFKKLRAFWNHKKAVKLGDHLFCVMLSLLFQHLVSIPLPNMILLYIDIFGKLLQETIQYCRTKALPLICCACFVKPNKFQDLCMTFLDYFGVNIEYCAPVTTKTEKVNGKSITKYIRDSGRAKKQHGLYLQCLLKLRKQLQDQAVCINIPSMANCNQQNNHLMQANQKINMFQNWIVDNKTSYNNQFILKSQEIDQIQICNNQVMEQEYAPQLEQKMSTTNSCLQSSCIIYINCCCSCCCCQCCDNYNNPFADMNLNYYDGNVYYDVDEFCCDQSQQCHQETYI